MERVLEERPTMIQRLGPRIGTRFLPVATYSSYRIVWEKIREYSPMAGGYAMEDLPNTMDELDFETFQSDVYHWGARMTLSPKQLMFLRFAGQVQAVNANTGYGVGPAADDYRQRDTQKMAQYTRMMNDAMDNVLEYLQMKALLGRIVWPPRDEDGNQIAAASLPLSMGRQKLNQPYGFLANSSGNTDGFEQNATSTFGVASSISSTGVAWNNVTTANPIHDMEVIGDLLEDRMSLTNDNLLVLMARKVLAFLGRNANILDWILGENRDRQFMTTSQQREFIQTQFGWTVEYYQSKWEYVKQDELDDTKPAVRQVPYMDYGTVLILPRPEIQEMGKIASCPAPGPAHTWQAGKYMWIVRDEKPPFKADMGMGAFWWPLVFDTDLRFLLHAWS
jgi:hypothetical protein